MNVGQRGAVRHSTSMPALVLALLLMLVASSCGGDDDDAASGGAAATLGSTTTGPGGAPATDPTTTGSSATSGLATGADSTGTDSTGTDSTSSSGTGGGVPDFRGERLATLRWTNGIGNAPMQWTDGDPSRNVYCDPTTIDMRSVAAADAGWPGPGDTASARNSTAGCGGVQLAQVFPAPATGALWAARFYFKQDASQIHAHQHGLGDLNPVGAIDIVFHRVEGTIGGQFVHGLNLGRGEEPTSGLPGGDDGGRLFSFTARMDAVDPTPRMFEPDVWYRFEWILEWVEVDGAYPNWRYRVYPRIHAMDGTRLADETTYRHNDGNYTLAEFYAAGSTFQRRDSTGEEGEVRDYYFGIAQSKPTDTGRVYWAAVDVGLPVDLDDFLGPAE